MSAAPANVRAELRAALAAQRAHALRASSAIRADAGRGLHTDPVADALAQRVVELRRQIDGEGVLPPIELYAPADPAPIAQANRRRSRYVDY